MKIAVFLVLVLGMGTVHAARNQVIERIALTQLSLYGMRQSLNPAFLFASSTELRKELNLSRDWDSAVENLFAAFDPAKFEQLTEIYRLQDDDDDLETMSQKNWLHRWLLNGAVDVADKMVEMGLELDKVDLQGLLLYALQGSSHADRNSKAHRWWDWLVAHGASVDEPHIIELFKDAALTNDVFRLDWLKDNLLTDTAADRATFISALNVALPLTPRTGAGQAAMWLLKHGADASVLEETELLQAIMFSYLLDTGRVSVPLAQYASKSGHEHLLSEMLSKIVSSGVGISRSSGVSYEHIHAMEYLLELGAKLSPKRLQDILDQSLTEGNFVLASWVMAQGADLTTIDLNSIVSDNIERWWRYNNKPKGYIIFDPVDIEDFFAFLRLHDFDHSQLDAEQLLKEAEEKNITVAIEQLKNAVSEQEENDSISAAEIWQQLYKKMPIERIDNEPLADDSADLLLYIAAMDYFYMAADRVVQNTVWLRLYIGKARGTSSMVDTLVEFIHLLPRESSHSYNAKMDTLIESMGLREEKTTIAQAMLDHIFNSEAAAEKYPFPLSFVSWAMYSGADLGQLDQYAVLRAIIDNELLKHSVPMSPNINDILETILKKEESLLQGIDQQRVLQEAEAHGGAEYKAAAEKVMETLEISS